MKPVSYFVVIFLLLSLSCTNKKSGPEVKMDHFIDSLISEMTLEEKVGQMTQYTSGWDVTGPVLNRDIEKELEAGRVGSIFNALTVPYVRQLQETAVTKTRLGIPLIFGYDVIHGYKTIFPLPLAEACSWDLNLIEKTAALSAKEATSTGLNWAFNPMVDIARDPRWGRVAEGAGEDPYYGSLVGAAKVKGYQGKDLSDPTTLLACVKHFAAYGAAEAGREYNSVDMSERMLRDVYLKPYHAAVEAGAGSVMTSFNDLNGTPATANRWLMTDILRNEWGFKGLVVTDYTSMNELVNHGIASNEKEAALLAINAGVDMDMQGADYMKNLPTLVKEGKVKESQIDQAVYWILKEKYELGLFDDPYRYLDEKREKETILSKEMLDHALQSGRESIVLLKNDTIHGKPLLPISKNVHSIALIGPLGDSQEDMLGSWHGSGEAKDVVTLLQGIKNKVPGIRVKYAQGCPIVENNRNGFSEAIHLAKTSDLVILALGEGAWQNGEASSRSDIGLPGLQSVLAEVILATGKPVVAVLMAGRPLTISWLTEHTPAIVNAWQLGTMAGPAIADVLFGDFNPSGKLVISFPRNTGQIPVYYNMKNTGRPKTDQKYTSKYLDIPNTPLYPFGYGLSYTTFDYSDITLNKTRINFSDTLAIKITVKNTGERDGDEVVQMYIRDLVGSVTRPVKELKGYKKIHLKPGEENQITFKITSEDLKFYDNHMKYVAEPGLFKVFVGRNSADVKEADFELVGE